MRLLNSTSMVFVAAVVLAACNSDSEPESPAPTDGGTSPLPACGAASGAGVYVKTVSPADQEKGTLRLPYFKVTLSGGIDCAANQAPAFKLRKGSVEVPLTPVKCSGGSVFEFQPAQQLEHATEYVLALDGLLGTDGAKVAACQSTFTTKSKTVAVDTYAALSLARDEDGTLWAWGESPTAYAAPDPATRPWKVPVEGKVAAGVSGEHYLLALLEDGTLWSLGNNNNGQLGRGAVSGSEALGKVPLTLPDGVKLTAVSAGPQHVLALRSDGKVMAWGRNASGQIGTGALSEHVLAPTEVLAAAGTPLTDVIAVEASSGSQGNGSPDGGWSLALMADGTVWAWGANNVGQAGGASTDDKVLYPVKLTTVPAARSISARYNQGFALSSNGSELRAWGDAQSGALGTGVCHVSDQPPLAVQGLSQEVFAVSAGRAFGLAILADKTLWVWGDNSGGVVGDGTTGVLANCKANGGAFDDEHAQMTPKLVAGLTDVVAVAGGAKEAIVLKGDGTVWMAGHNVNDVLGLPADAVELENGIVATYQQVPGL